jgi:hypothetical protein
MTSGCLIAIIILSISAIIGGFIGAVIAQFVFRDDVTMVAICTGVSAITAFGIVYRIIWKSNSNIFN